MPLMQSQKIFLKKLVAYLAIMSKKKPEQYHINDINTHTGLINYGYCSGMVGLWLYYKRKNKLQYFYENIINPILAWNATEQSLSKALEDTMEYALTAVTWLQCDYLFKQAISGMMGIQQSDYDVLLNLIKQKEDPILRKEYEIAFVFTNQEVEEILESIPKTKSIKLAISDHAFGLEYDNHTKEYVLFDPNGFLDETTKEHFFERRFPKDKIEDLIKNIQQASGSQPNAELIGLSISVFDDIQRPMPKYINRVELIKQILARRHATGKSIAIDQGSTYDEASPLWFAAKQKHQDTAQFLLTQGAQPEQKNKKGVGIIFIAANNGHDPILKLLLDPLPSWVAQRLINEPMDSTGCTSLHVAAMDGHISTVEFLLSKGAKIGTGNPLRDAIKAGHIKVVELLLNTPEGQSLINFQTEKIAPLLYIALEYRHFEIANLLLNKGAKLEETLHFAILQKKTKVIQWIIKKDAAAVDQKAIYTASKTDNSDLFEMLLNTPNGKVFMNEAVYYNQTPLALATAKNLPANVRLLLKKGAKIDLTSIQYASQMENRDILEMLLDTFRGRVLINEADEDGDTLLFLATAKGLITNVQVLLQKGASVDPQSIQYASRINNSIMLKVFLDTPKGQALVNEPDEDGNTPLFAATTQGLIKNVQLLLENGAIIEPKTIGYATQMSDSTILQALLERQSVASKSVPMEYKDQRTARYRF